MDRGQCTALVTVAIIVSAMVTGVTVGTGIAAADESETLLGDVFDGDTSDKARAGLEAAWAGLSGAHERAVWKAGKWYSSAFGDDSGITASEEADGLASYYNANSASLESWANDRKNWTSNHTVKISLSIDDTSATRYLVTTASNGNITSSEMVGSTNRTADHSLELCGYAAEQSVEELRYFNEEYASDDRDVDAEYLGKMKGKYNSDVETSLYDSSGTCGGDS